MPDYSKGKIYRIYSPSHLDAGVYIGSTTQPLCKRIVEHRSGYLKFKEGKETGFVSSFHILQYDDARIELIEECPCENKEQLLRKEGEYIRTTEKCVNRFIAGRTSSQYREDNREEISAKAKAYHEAHKEEILANVKAYREAHRNVILAKKKASYEAHRDELLAKQKAYREAHRDVISAKGKAYYEAHRDIISAYRKAYREAHRDIISARMKAYRQKKKAESQASASASTSDP